MAELREHANHLQQENERLRAYLETNGVENPQGAAQHVPLTRADKGKGVALPDHGDHPADDEFFSDSSPLPHRSSPQNNAEVEFKKRPSLQSSKAISGTCRRMRKERPVEIGPVRNWPRNIYLPGSDLCPPPPQFSPERYPFGIPPPLHATFYPPVRGPYDMLSSPLG